MQGVGGRQRVVNRVPVVEFIGHVEVRHPEKRRVRRCSAQLLRCRPAPDRILDGVHDVSGIVAEHFLSQRIRAIPIGGLLALLEQGRKFLPRLPQQRRQVDGMPPRAQFLAATSAGHAMHQAGQDLARVFPPDVVQQLKGFVGEV